MAHVTRSRRKLNNRRKKLAKERIELPMFEQLKRAEASQLAQDKRYPYPPNYQYSFDAPKPTQPTCYNYNRATQVQGGIL